MSGGITGIFASSFFNKTEGWAELGNYSIWTAILYCRVDNLFEADSKSEVTGERCENFYLQRGRWEASGGVEMAGTSYSS
jgi:hypothetical protein